jgi:hypothetical protein
MMDQRPDPLWRERPARSRKRVLAMTAVAVAAYVAYISTNAPGSCSAPGGGPCNAAAPQFSVRVVPRQPPSLAVCLRRERARNEAGDRLINQACRPGRADWYHAVQATLIPRLPLAPSLATALGESRLDT